MNFLLRMKPWILFVFMMLPIVAQTFTMFAMYLAGTVVMGGAEDDEFGMLIVSMGILLVTVIISIVFTFGWMYAVGTQLYPKLPEGHTLKLGRFKFAIFYVLIYFIVFIVMMIAMVANESPGFIFAILPFHFLAMLCMLYNLRFVAKSIKTFELKRNARFADYAGEFFLIWFYFIGVWIIQPRINNIFAAETSEYGGPVDRYLK